jgi:methionyl-tRNA formyltransferase
MSRSANLVFCGTPRFAVPSLEKLVAAGFSLRLVVTQPDKPRGRGLELAPSAVKQRAIELGVAVAQPDRIKNNADFRRQLAELQPEAIVVVGYGRMIPQWMIDLPPLGNINLHASLLPKYRGAAPIQWAIASGESVTGNTTMRIDLGLDTGDILQQQEVMIDPRDTAETLAPRLADSGADLLVDTLERLRAGIVQPRRQDDAQSTLAPMLKKEDGHIDFHRPAQQICDRLRGFQPWPGAFTSFRGKNLNLWAAKAIHHQFSCDQPQEGSLALEAESLIVRCGQDTALALIEVQLEGKKRMAAPDFIHGYHPQGGERLGA